MMKKFILTSLALGIGLQAQAGYLSNFNEPNTDKLTQALKDGHIHVVQFGDSHTAGDSMTGALRDRLQERYGDGGMGWAMPMYFKGQRLVKFGYDNYQWTPISSRNNQTQNYTLGGLLAKPNFAGSSLTIKAKKPQNTTQSITVSIRQGAYDGEFSGIDADGYAFTLQAPIKNGQWQTTQITAKPPFTITAQGNVDQSYIGGWWATNPYKAGAVVSALGINGAQLAHWDRWDSQAWQNEIATISPELIILAYGTNEAYGNNPDLASIRQILVEKIRQIRQAAPNSALMIISAPEALKSTAGSCGTRPTQLTNLQQLQKEVAQSEGTLFWDWQAAMGGSCSMKSWIRQGLASNDGVHFTHQGYTQLGNSLADDILSLIP